MSYIAFPATTTTGSVAYTASDAVVGAPVGDGTLITGASTAGSIVSIAIPDGMQSWILLLKGYVSGAIYTEASNNSTNGTDGDWAEVKGRRTGTAPGTESVVYAMVANGYYHGNCSGFRYLRARLIGATGPTARFEVSTALGPTFLNSGIPGGSSNIGSVGIDQTTPGTTNLVAAGGNVASGATDAGNPVKMGGKSNSAVPTPVTTGQRTDSWLDTYGRQVIVDTDPELGISQGITSYRERVTATRFSVLSDSIADGLATFWTQSTSTGGTITVSAGEGLLQTSAAANGSAQLVSTIPLYVPGQSHWNIAAARFGDTGVANNIRRVGAFTVSGGVPQDGFAFELNGTTFNAVVFKAGVATATASTSWTRAATAPFTPDANYHLWEERWTGNRVDFYIDNVLRHTVSGTTSTITTTLNFPMAAQNINSTNATNVVLAVRNIGLGRFGSPQLTDGTSTVTTLADGAGGVGLGTSIIATNFVAGPGNTTTAQLASGATFTGTIETIFNQQAVSILLTSDQNGTLVINQYIDAAGTRKASAFTYNIVAGVGFSRSIVSNGNYLNLTFKNTGTSTTTTLNINTFYGTLPPITNAGNTPVSIDEINGVTVGARPDGFLRTVLDPTTLLFDTFETVDTTNTWTLGGTVPTGTSGVLTFNAGSTASATSYAVSKPAFTPGASAYLQFAALVTVEATVPTGTNRFWGLGILTAPTSAVPITNGTIFEIDTTGVLFGSVYSASTRTQTVTLTKPTDGLLHRYAIYYKASRVYFEIDNVIVSTLPFPNPAVSALNLVIGQANSGAVTGTPTLTSTLMGLGDTARNATKLADGLFPWRTTTIKPSSTAAIATDSALVVTMHPSSTQLKTSIYESELNLTAGMTNYRETAVAPRYNILSDSIADGLATFWTQSTASGGTITVTGGEGLVQSNTTTTGSAQLLSTVVNYLPSQTHFMSTSARFGDTGSAGNIRRLGISTVTALVPQDGFAYELNGTTLNAVSYKAGVASATASTSWTSFATSPFTLDTNYHTWEIRYTGNRADFYIDHALRHSIVGTLTTITSTLSFPMMVQSVSSSGTTNRIVAVRNIAVGRFGSPDNTMVSAGQLASASVVNRGGTITTGGTAQVLAAANTFRTGLTLQNTHATADLWLTEDGATTAALNVGYKLPAGASAKINTQKAISIWGNTTGQTFAATEF